MNNLVLYLGIFAGICTSLSLLPQLIKIIKEKKADDISYWMLGLLLVGLGAWIAYGIMREDWPIIITNSFSALLNTLIIFFKAKRERDVKEIKS